MRRPFEQADASTTRKYGGTGLGLTISVQLSELMGGRLWVESEEGQGSTFHLTSVFERDDSPRKQQVDEKPAVLQDMPVVIVDDNSTNRRIIEATMRNWQMSVQSAANGIEALALLERERSGCRNKQ